MKNFTPVEKKVKPFSWSYSKIKNYRVCPFRYKRIDVDKAYKEDFTGPDLAWGNKVHEAFARRIGMGAPLPADLVIFEDACIRLLQAPGKIMVEQQLAITKELNPCEWFGDNAWFRGIADFLSVSGKVALAVDYKTGKILEDSQQLALLAECVFAHYPQVEAVRTEFWWLKDDAVTRRDFHRKDRRKTWVAIFPEVKALEQAHMTNSFPPTKTGLCRKHCIVAECQHHGGK